MRFEIISGNHIPLGFFMEKARDDSGGIPDRAHSGIEEGNSPIRFRNGGWRTQNSMGD